MGKVRAWFGRRNWWKISFFFMFFLFECAREVAVIATYEPPTLGSSAIVGHYGDYVTATGEWKRLDGGEKLEPSALTIQCWQNEGSCTVASIASHDNFVTAPDISRYNAKFTDDAVTYQDDAPVCVTFSVRIDLKLKKVFATRDLKPNAPRDVCAHYERRMELTFGNGFEWHDVTKEHFLPIMSVLGLLLGK